MRILVVEDAPLIRGFTVEALREEGYDVIHASTGVGLGMVHAAGRPTCSSPTKRYPERSTGGRSLNAVVSMIRDRGDLRDWIFTGSGTSSAGQSVLAQTLSSGRDLAGRKTSGEKSTCIRSGVAVSVRPYRCGC